MVDEPIAPTPSKDEAPVETDVTDTDVSATVYQLDAFDVITEAAGTVAGGLMAAAFVVGMLFSGFTEDLNLSANTFIVLSAIVGSITLIWAGKYLWDRINLARTFRITSDHNGLTLQKDKKNVNIAWKEVVSFQEYKVVGPREAVIKLPPKLRDRDKLREVIEEKAAEPITRNLISRFKVQGKVTLGIIDITDKALLIRERMEKGSLIEEQSIPWEDIADIDIDEEKIVRVIMPSLKLRRIAPVSEIPNYYALVAFVELLRNKHSGVRTVEPQQPATSRVEDFEQAVFISYAWGGKSEEIVDQIDQSLEARAIKIIRDKHDLGFKGSISEFMKRIGHGNCVIVVISDKYLRSPNCMFELVEIADNKQFSDRIFPIVLRDADIYDPVRRLEYVKHWEVKRGELADAMRTVDPANLQGIRDDMDNYDRFRDKVSGLTSILKDMNTLTPDIHRESDFSILYESIEKRQKNV